jgi:hypothetical protein
VAVGSNVEAEVAVAIIVDTELVHLAAFGAGDLDTLDAATVPVVVHAIKDAPGNIAKFDHANGFAADFFPAQVITPNFRAGVAYFLAAVTVVFARGVALVIAIGLIAVGIVIDPNRDIALVAVMGFSHRGNDRRDGSGKNERFDPIHCHKSPFQFES